MKRAVGFVWRRAARSLAEAAAFVMLATPAMAGDMPAIRTSTANRVPACVTPERLMDFVAGRNRTLSPKLGTVASAYRDLGEAWHVRWDYAFYQMLLETNYLMYRRGDGSSGDVNLTQNNFAGIGATGGGVPGDRYPDVRTGVLAHIQHLVAYSGELVERPVAQRTRENQADIIEISRKLGRPVTFADLSRRWATDRAYAKNIETIAELYRKSNCTAAATLAPVRPVKEARAISTLSPPSKLGAMTEADTSAAREPAPKRPSAPLVRTIWQRGDPVPPVPRRAEPPRVAPPAAKTSSDETTGRLDPSPEPLPAPVPVLVRPPVAISASEPRPAELSGAGRFALAARAVTAAAVPAPVPARGVCRVVDAGGSGAGAVLIRRQAGRETRLTALSVEPGSNVAAADGLVAGPASDGELLGTYGDREAALFAARRLCPRG